MKAPAKDKAISKKEAGNETMRTLKHDINNQLSNILLALEQLRYELPDPSEDCTFYIDSIAISTARINTLLKEASDY
jgi:nitrogen-specific signal transduction histidine kinase